MPNNSGDMRSHRRPTRPVCVTYVTFRSLIIIRYLRTFEGMYMSIFVRTNERTNDVIIVELLSYLRSIYLRAADILIKSD
jgi:hypothetical protein